jgi:hypothetical protein
VLDRDYFTVPDVQIKQIKSLLTIVDGRKSRTTPGHTLAHENRGDTETRGPLI